MAFTFRQYMWLFQHMFCLSHTCVVKSTYYTGSSCVAFTTQVCFIAHTCGNHQTCVENPNRQVLGFFLTCLVKHTHRLISPWANGATLWRILIAREDRCRRLAMRCDRCVRAGHDLWWQQAAGSAEVKSPVSIRTMIYLQPARRDQLPNEARKKKSPRGLPFFEMYI